MMRKEYYTNIYSVDVKGTGAGGAFTTIHDIECFWNALVEHRLLSKDMTKRMLSIQAKCKEEDDYGYGIWIDKKCSSLPYFTGSDPGVSFISTYELNKGINITIVSNFGDNVWKLMRQIKQEILD